MKHAVGDSGAAGAELARRRAGLGGGGWRRRRFSLMRSQLPAYRMWQSFEARRRTSRGVRNNWWGMFEDA